MSALNVVYTCEEHTFEKLIKVTPDERRSLLNLTDGDNAIIHALGYVAGSHAAGYIECRPSEDAVMKKHHDFLVQVGRTYFTASSFAQFITNKRELFISMAEDPIFWCALLSPIVRNICIAQSILREPNVQHRVNLIRLAQIKESYETAVENRLNYIRKAQLEALNRGESVMTIVSYQNQEQAQQIVQSLLADMPEQQQQQQQQTQTSDDLLLPLLSIPSPSSLEPPQVELQQQQQQPPLIELQHQELSELVTAI